MFVTLFNLQGAHRSQRREFILPSRFALVKHFFQVFQTFFSAFPRGNHPVRSPAALADDLFILPPLPRFVKHFFQIFFDLFSRSTRSGRGDALASRKRFAIIANFPSLVNHFFRFFSVFFHFVLRQPYLLSFARFYTQNVGSDGTSPAPSTRPAPKAAAPAPSSGCPAGRSPGRRRPASTPSGKAAIPSTAPGMRMAVTHRFLFGPGKNLLCRLPQGKGQHPQQRQVRKGPQGGDDALHRWKAPLHSHAFGQSKKGAVQPPGQLRAQIADDHRLLRPQQRQPPPAHSTSPAPGGGRAPCPPAGRRQRPHSPAPPAAEPSTGAPAGASPHHRGSRCSPLTWGRERSSTAPAAVRRTARNTCPARAKADSLPRAIHSTSRAAAGRKNHREPSRSPEAMSRWAHSRSRRGQQQLPPNKIEEERQPPQYRPQPPADGARQPAVAQPQSAQPPPQEQQHRQGRQSGQPGPPSGDGQGCRRQQLRRRGHQPRPQQGAQLGLGDLLFLHLETTPPSFLGRKEAKELMQNFVLPLPPLFCFPAGIKTAAHERQAWAQPIIELRAWGESRKVHAKSP